VSRETDRMLQGMPGSIAGYLLEGYIGRSDTGAVYLARDERLGRKVAFKVVAPELAQDAAFRARFLRESREAAVVGHPHIIPVYQAGEADGIVYLAMRYVQDGDARSLVSRLGPLGFAQAWSIIAQVASALDAAHAHGLIHRDVKPASMLVEAGGAADSSTPYQTGRGDVAHVYLSDFGMGLNQPPGESSATGQYAGTLDYVAPERIRGRALDGRADLYSLACAGFELLCGTPPFAQDQGLTVMYDQLYVPPPPATARRPDLPAGVDAVLATALAKNPADRYATCGEFAEELQAALGLRPVRSRSQRLAGSPPEARPSGVEEPARPYRPAPAPAPLRPGAGALPSPPAPAAAGTLRPQGPAPAPAPSRPGAGALPSPPAPPAAGPDLASGPVARPGTGPEPVSGAADPDPQPRRRRPARVRLIVAVAAVAITAGAVAVGVGVAHPSRSAPAASVTPATSAPPITPATSAVSSPAAPATPSVSASLLASRQAAAVSNLLGSSEAARLALEGAVSQVRACTNLSGAVSQIQTVADQRTAEYDQASALSTADLASGAIVKSDLITALRDSLNADRDYLTWARQQLSTGCTPGAQSSAYLTAYDADQQANAAKAQFALIWDPIATRYGVNQESPNSI
jgi:serine/threonine protein kinase